MTSRAFGLAFSVFLHAALIGCAVYFSVRAKNAVVPADSDPLLLIFADENADPTKAAGLVGEERGLARGSTDGDTLKETGEANEENSEQFQLDDLPPPPPEPEPAAPEPVPAQPAPTPVPAETVPAKSEPAAAKPAKKTAPAKSEKKPAAKPAANTSATKKTSFADWKKSQKKSSGGNSKKSSGAKKSGSGNAPSIDVGKIGIGGGNGGKRFGTADGTGGNGGDGGRAVASAQQAYALEVANKLMKHLDDVLMQSPLTLERTLVVSVRLSVDERGNIRFLEVPDSSDSQVRDRVRKAVERIGKFRAPPEGRAFEMRIPNVALRPL